MRSEMNSWRNIDSDYPLPLRLYSLQFMPLTAPKKKRKYKIYATPPTWQRAAHVGKVNSNRFFFYFFFSVFVLHKMSTLSRSAQCCQHGKKKRVAMAPVQTTATATATALAMAIAIAIAMLHFVASLFTFLMRLSWLKPMGQRTLAGFASCSTESWPGCLYLPA